MQRIKSTTFIASVSLIAIGAVIFFGFLFSYTIKVLSEDHKFHETSCLILNSTIINSTVGHHHSNSKKRYLVLMSINYNNTYTNSQIQTTAYNIYRGKYSTLKDCERFQQKYRVGTVHHCFYNTKDPSVVVFNFNNSSDSFVASMIGGCFIAVGIFFLLMLIYLEKEFYPEENHL